MIASVAKVLSCELDEQTNLGKRRVLEPST